MSKRDTYLKMSETDIGILKIIRAKDNYFKWYGDALQNQRMEEEAKKNKK